MCLVESWNNEAASFFYPDSKNSPNSRQTCVHAVRSCLVIIFFTRFQWNILELITTALHEFLQDPNLPETCIFIQYQGEVLLLWVRWWIHPKASKDQNISLFLSMVSWQGNCLDPSSLWPYIWKRHKVHTHQSSLTKPYLSAFFFSWILLKTLLYYTMVAAPKTGHMGKQCWRGGWVMIFSYMVRHASIWILHSLGSLLVII